MKKIILKISYDGTQYSGWQRQDNAIGIQEVIEKNLEKICGEKIVLKAAGRTDAGVHAEAQIADFMTNSTIPGKKIKYPLNDFLPDDIRIISSNDIDIDFSSRFDALYKHYRYTLYTDESISAMKNRYVTVYTYPLDIKKMIEASKFMIGNLDYKSYEGKFSQMTTSVRRIIDIKIIRDGKYIYFDIFGEAFLKNMVRIMVGTLLNVGRNIMTFDELRKTFEVPDRTKTGVTMPAKGLTMMKIYYDKKYSEIIDN